MSGQCELLSFSENHLQSSSSPLLSLQLQARLLCRDNDARFQETPPSFTLVDDLEAPISDEDIELLAPLFCDEEIEALCAAPQASSMQSSRPRPDDLVAGKKRMSSPPWPSCIADDDEDEEEAGPPPSPPPPPTKKARTETKSRSWREHEPPLPPPPFPPPIKKARTQTKRRSRPEHAAARADRLRHRLQKCHNTIATRILMREFRPFRAPELSRGRTALRCQCPELALLAGDEHKPRVFGCCALHQDAPPEHRAWMYSAQGHAPPLVGGPGEVLVPAASAGSSRAMVRQYVRWRRSVSMPSRFYVQRAVEKGLAAQLPDDDWTMPESPDCGLPDDDWTMPDYGSLGL